MKITSESMCAMADHCEYHDIVVRHIEDSNDFRDRVTTNAAKVAMLECWVAKLDERFESKFVDFDKKLSSFFVKVVVSVSAINIMTALVMILAIFKGG